MGSHTAPSPDPRRQYTPAMARHHLPATTETVHWGFFDASLPPVLRVESGDTVTVDTVSGGPEVTPADISRVLPEHLAIHEQLEPDLGPHIITGPIAVDLSKPGDTVELEILDIRFRTDWGWNAQRPGLGTLPDDFPDERIVQIDIDLEVRSATLPWGQQLDPHPFFGILATAPPAERGRISSKPPGLFGGNIDNKELGVGARVFLPVFVEGGLVSIGDGHGKQGDGEVCVTALETCLTGEFRITLHKGETIASPRAITSTHYVTHGFDPDLDVAAQLALRDMLDWIVDTGAISRAEAYTLCSLACDLHVTQLVNGTKGVHAMLPVDVMAATGVPA